MNGHRLPAVALCAIVTLSSRCVIENPSSTSAIVPSITARPRPSPVPAAGSAPSPREPEPPPTPGVPAEMAEMAECAVDTECVAVPRNGCCNNGYREALNASHAEAYKASFVCPDPHPICPMFRVRDDRNPACNPSTHRCELVGPR